MEIWKQIDGFNGKYEVSNTGFIRSFKKSRHGLCSKSKILKGNRRSGYPSVILDKKHYTVHRIVAQTFIQNLDNKPCINHKNGIKTDNRVENLEWCTYKENIDHAFRIGLMNSGHSKGINNHTNKLTEKQIRIAKYALSFGARGIGVVLAKMFGVSHQNISLVKRGLAWKEISV